MKVNVTTMVFGTIVFMCSLGAWLYASEHGLQTDIIWTVTVPIIIGLFLGEQLSKTASNAAKAVEQTNGSLSAKIETIVARALANRDAARTRQAQGDVGGPTPTIIVKDDHDA